MLAVISNDLAFLVTTARINTDYRVLIAFVKIRYPELILKPVPSTELAVE